MKGFDMTFNGEKLTFSLFEEHKYYNPKLSPGDIIAFRFADEERPMNSSHKLFQKGKYRIESIRTRGVGKLNQSYVIRSIRKNSVYEFSYHTPSIDKLLDIGIVEKI
jgi:hypothetical protein